MDERRRQPGTSGWALAACVCSAGLFCPPLPVLGAVLGVRALRHVAAVPGRRGRGLAIAAIVVGLVGTTWWIVAASWWNSQARRPMIEGPRAALTSGLAGDVEAFRRGFHDPGTRDDAEAFVAELARRYGTLRSIRQAQSTTPDGAAMRQGRVLVPYEIEFSRQTVPADAVFVVYERGTAGLVLEFGSIMVRDPQQGDLRYPTPGQGNHGS